MRIAVKSAGGITEAFLHVESVEDGIHQAARQLAEDYGLPIEAEIWSDDPNGASPPRRLGELRFVALDGNGHVVELD